MNDIRHFINIVESSDHRRVFHAGTFTGGEYDPFMVGEPGNLRPMGIGIYAAKTRDHAERYLKYVTGSTVKIFEISPDAKLYPWGGVAWKSVSPELQQWWTDKSNEVQKKFEQYGWVKKSSVDGQYRHWTFAVLSQGDNYMRKVLANLGVDGAFTYLPNDLVEYVFYNTKVLKLVSQQPDSGD